MFESNVILDRYKTKCFTSSRKITFESNVILDRYKTKAFEIERLIEFESNVILDRYKTNGYLYKIKAKFESNVIKKWCQPILSTPFYYTTYFLIKYSFNKVFSIKFN